MSFGTPADPQFSYDLHIEHVFLPPEVTYGNTYFTVTVQRGSNVTDLEFEGQVADFAEMVEGDSNFKFPVAVKTSSTASQWEETP